MIVRVRDERDINITPGWWHRDLGQGTPTEQVLQKARCIVDGLGSFAFASPEAKGFVGLFIEWTTNVRWVVARVAVPDHMTDEDVGRARTALVEHFNERPPQEAIKLTSKAGAD